MPADFAGGTSGTDKEGEMLNNVNVPSRAHTNVWPRLLFATLICASLASGCAAARGRSDSNDTATQKQDADNKPKDNFFSGG